MTLRIYDKLDAEGTEHENTVTEGDIAQTTFPAGFWTPGKIVKFEGTCVVNDNNSTDTLTPRVRFGVDGTTVTNDDQLGVGAAVDVADADEGFCEGTLHCQDVGDGTYQLIARTTISDVDAQAAGTNLVQSFVAVSTAFDPAVATYLSYTMDWSVAHADNEVAARSWHVAECV